MPKFIDITGKRFNEWEVLEYLGKSYWRCRCSCGKICNKTSYSLIHGTNKSCGHNLRDKFEGTVIGNITVLAYNNDGTYACKCICGEQFNAKTQLLKARSTTECKICRYKRNRITLFNNYGETSTNRIATPREKWQLDILNDKNNMQKWLSSFGHKLYIYEIADKLNTSKGEIRKTIREMGLEEYTMLGRELIRASNKEKDVLEYIKNIYSGTVVENDKTEIYPKELDIYIPEKKIAIEFNGNYYHSSLYKKSNYHQEKTIACARKGIHLIHVFEYEWDNNRDKIQRLLNEIILGTKTIYGRNTYITHTKDKDAIDFFNKYHINGYSKASITLGLIHNNKVVSMMSFGSPRFNHEYQYEIIRYATVHGYTVVGGTSKLIKYFISQYKAESILTYVDISKFKGESYIKAGMTPCKEYLTVPGYVWVNSDNNVLSRYSTQKSKLISSGVCSEYQTEDEAMTELGYYKVYDCGNLKIEWRDRT